MTDVSANSTQPEQLPAALGAPKTCCGGFFTRARIPVTLFLLLGNVLLWWLVYSFVREDRASEAARTPFRGLDGFSAPAFLGFDVSNALIPKEEIMGGGPPKDGIPSIDKPKFVPVRRVDYLEDGDLVLGVVRDGEARAYPLRILVWHEIVNDTIGGTPVAVTYCPLCGTCMVFDRRVGGKKKTFGVSGLLYNSDVLMYDRETDSLWSQLKMSSVAGKHAGDALTWLPSEQMTWAAWKARYPDSEVLSTNTGFGHDYKRQPYEGYESNPNTMFPVPRYRPELPNKAWVVGIIVDGVAKAYERGSLAALPGGRLEDTVAGKSVAVRYDAEAMHAQFTDADGQPIPSVAAYWFAWQGFYPKTELYLNAGG